MKSYGARTPLGFVNPLLYKIAAESGSPLLTANTIYDVLAAGEQAIERHARDSPATGAH
jgi:hypothetical protein